MLQVPLLLQHLHESAKGLVRTLIVERLYHLPDRGIAAVPEILHYLKLSVTEGHETSVPFTTHLIGEREPPCGRLTAILLQRTLR